VALSLPPNFDKPSGAAVVEDKRSTKAHATSADDKLRTLKQYHRAGELCDRCAEKWSYGHKCALTVQLHVI
jgi:hypothetical protein